MQGVYDAARVFAIVEGGLIYGLVAYVFALANAIVEDVDELGNPMLRTSLRHIYLVAGSYLLAVLFICVEVADRLGARDLTLRTPFACVIFSLAIFALLEMTSVLKARLRARTPTAEEVREILR